MTKPQVGSSLNGSPTTAAHLATMVSAWRHERDGRGKARRGGGASRGLAAVAGAARRTRSGGFVGWRLQDSDGDVAREKDAKGGDATQVGGGAGGIDLWPRRNEATLVVRGWWVLHAARKEETPRRWQRGKGRLLVRFGGEEGKMMVSLIQETRAKRRSNMGKRRREEGGEEAEENSNVNLQVPRHLIDNVKCRPIFIFDNASLSKGMKLKILSGEEDSNFLKRQGKNPNDYRPDIIHEALRGVLDSRLNKAGMVSAIYVKTDSGLLFEIKPHVRIPRTCKRFLGLMWEVLIRVLKDPVARYLPDNTRIIGLSYSSQKLVDIEDYVSCADDDTNLAFMVGAMAHGKISCDKTDDYISSKLPFFSAQYFSGVLELYIVLELSYRIYTSKQTSDLLNLLLYVKNELQKPDIQK
ncbi:hypothetical protein Tsubulata_025531 [Turnera subulata]|uniref:Ribosomal RNA small subunit methyltransferase NEP1 n=1 Tax=Turnera subulata TaxID=218843 RepID=A0A9Q0FHV1_9ROSI|nr:hypothetical protein Tsubulata_025531 [Turnera subulata]